MVCAVTEGVVWSINVLSVTDYYIGCAQQNQLHSIHFAFCECSICVTHLTRVQQKS